MLTRWIKGSGVTLILALVLVACGNQTPVANAPSNNNVQPNETEASQSGANAEPAGKRVVTYLDELFELPEKVERIVITGAVESMEDSILLDVNPVGAISFSGKFPPLFESITKNAVSVGEKTEPNFEAILALKPDVILGSTKFPEEVTEKLKSIAPTILYSHVSTNWEANLRLLGELSGKEAQAEEIISGYHDELKQASSELGEKLKDKKVAVVRVRSGKMYVYPQDVFFNPVLYADLGLTPPAEIEGAKAQQELSVEQFADMDADYVFLQCSEDENKETPDVLAELQNNPIMKNTKAFKEGKVFVNIIDPLAQGGTAYSKTHFLTAVIAELSK
jgi:iron complex transport system substrate-binding protein